MIRKLKHIINKENNNLQSPTTPHQSPHDVVCSEMLKSLRESETPVNFIKRKFKSTKSWAKLGGKYPKLFKETGGGEGEDREEDPTYESMPNLEIVHHEFESYLSKMFHQQREASRQAACSQSTDYGFESSCDLTSLSSSAAATAAAAAGVRRNSSVKHSTLNSHAHAHTHARHEDESLMTNAENQLYFRILQRLASTSLAKPENIPLLCIKSFRPTDYEWAQLVARLGMTSRDDIQLIELGQGLPVNAMHYLPCLDLVYVKTADDLIGYLPRTHCKAIASSTQSTKDDQLRPSSSLLPRSYHQAAPAPQPSHRLTFHVPKTSYSETDKKELVEYHSLSSFEFLGDNKQLVPPPDSDKFFKPISEEQSITERQSSQDQMPSRVSDSSLSNESFTYEPTGNNRDSRQSKSNVNLKLVSDDYEDCADLAIDDDAVSPKQLERCLSGLQSRSRLPISLRSNLNLTLMDNSNKTPAGVVDKTPRDDRIDRLAGIQHNESYLNLISSRNLRADHRDKLSATKKTTNFEREKYVRRSLDSSLMSNKLFAIPIEFEDDHNHRHKLDQPNNKSMAEQQSNSKFRYNFMKQLDHFKQKNAIKYTDSTESIAQQATTTNPAGPVPYPELDIGKIELDSIKDTSIVQYLSNKETESFPTPDRGPERLWTVILQYTAQNPREMSVRPGFVILVIKENQEWLYVKLVEGDHNQQQQQQQYGFIPRNCAINFQELMTRSKKVEKKEPVPTTMMMMADSSKVRKSLVTAL